MVNTFCQSKLTQYRLKIGKKCGNGIWPNVSMGNSKTIEYTVKFLYFFWLNRARVTHRLSIHCQWSSTKFFFSSIAQSSFVAKNNFSVTPISLVILLIQPLYFLRFIVLISFFFEPSEYLMLISSPPRFITSLLLCQYFLTISLLLRKKN